MVILLISYAASIRSYKLIIRFSLICESGIATWLSCNEANVTTALTGISPSTQFKAGFARNPIVSVWVLQKFHGETYNIS